MGLALEAELPVLVLVLFGGEDGFDDVPVLCYLAAFDTEEVVEGHGLTPELPWLMARTKFPSSSTFLCLLAEEGEGLGFETEGRGLLKGYL